MLDWILRHAGGLLDWLAVFLSVFVFVLVIQYVLDFLKNSPDRDG
ncbi:hypothetical protein ACUUL3_14100 [Thiovibrio sp. JS02]